MRRQSTRSAKGRRARAARGTDQGGGGASLRRRQIAPGETERVALWLTRDVATRLRIHAATHRMALSVAVEQALTRYLEDADT